MPPAAVPIVAAIIGAGGGIAAAKISGDAQKKAAKKAFEAAQPKYAFSEEQRAALLKSLMGMVGGMPGGGQPGVVDDRTAGVASPDELNQYVAGITQRLAGPSAAYQAYLQALQERRDARSGVPLVPPQGAADASAQRSMPAQGGRSY